MILEEISATGGNAGACHAQMYTMGTLLRHGSRRAEAALPAEDRRAASCACRRSRVTEPDAGSDTTADQDDAPTQVDGGYVVNGQKIWTSRAEHSDLMLLLARTTPLDEVEQADRRALDVFLVDMRDGRRRARRSRRSRR